MLAWHLNRHKALAADLKKQARYVTRLLVEAGQVQPVPGACERCGRKVTRRARGDRPVDGTLSNWYFDRDRRLTRHFHVQGTA